VTLDACLPAALRGPATTFTRLSAGLSGAGVHRVDAGGRAYVLKVISPDEPLDAWRRATRAAERAAAAALAPRVVHADEGRRAVVSELVVDRSFPPLLGDPRTRDAALELLGRTLRRVHDLPVDEGGPPADPRALLGGVAPALLGWAGLPAFARDALRAALEVEPPACGRAPVQSHNDVNPTNLVLDGERLLLLDWTTAAPNEPYWDLATIAMFLRLDDAACLRLLAAHEGAPVDALPARFVHDRRLAAVLCGAMFLAMASRGGHAGAAGATRGEAPTLGDVYGRLRAGGLSVATAEGQWQLGLALTRTGADLGL